METIEGQVVRKTNDDVIGVSRGGINKNQNPGQKALLSIKNFNATLEKDFLELLDIESRLDELNGSGTAIIDANTTPEVTNQWKPILHEGSRVIAIINNILVSGKLKIIQKETEGYSELWTSLAEQVSALRVNSKEAVNTGRELLPEAIHPQWENEFVKPGTILLESIVSNVESCRVLLQMIERYSTDELNVIIKLIVDQVPANFTYEEAVEYQNDYYKALLNFKKEFKEEKNLWDKFLDILAGGTHQSPSERVMLERWIEGEKGDL